MTPQFTGPIFMINYTKPLVQRAKDRKFCGPYQWTPDTLHESRGFYQDSGSYVSMGDSTFSLRLEWANDALPYSRLTQINGYYTNSFQDETAKPIIALLPHGRGFLAGWTLGKGMCGGIERDIYEDKEDAARAAHCIAERIAEDEREAEERYQEEQDEAMDEAE